MESNINSRTTNITIKDKTMRTYIVVMITDLGEEVSVSVDAPSVSKAELIAIGMLENGELDCMSQICVEYTITEV